MNKMLLCLFLVLSMCFFIGCAKKQIVKKSPITSPEQEKVEQQKPEEVEPALSDEEPSLRGKEYKKVPQLETIYFDYDDAALKPEARTSLSKNAKWLKENPSVEVIVEGHCDERGTTDYNMALGDRRAKSVRSYLMKLGVKGNHIATISYGEEKPVDLGHNENAWSKNRRAEILGRIPPEKGKIIK
jgi:peptidoglycan-associated lipoprotein